MCRYNASERCSTILISCGQWSVFCTKFCNCNALAEPRMQFCCWWTFTAMVGTCFHLDGRRRSMQTDEHTTLIITRGLPHGRGRRGLTELALDLFLSPQSRCCVRCLVAFCHTVSTVSLLSPDNVQGHVQ